MSFHLARSQENPLVFMDFLCDSERLGRLEIELFADTSPKAEARPLGYKNAQVVKVFKEQYFLVDSPDSQELAGVVNLNDLHFSSDSHELGTLGLSVENSVTQFYVTLQKCEWLDGVMPVVGRVLINDQESAKVMEFVGNCLTLPGGKPKYEIKVVQCGQY